MTSTVATIEVWLSTLQQLFNSFDPSPFHERDLDRDAEEYIVGTADEFRSTQLIRLIVHLPSEQVPANPSFDLEKAVQHYFAYRRDETRRTGRAGNRNRLPRRLHVGAPAGLRDAGRDGRAHPAGGAFNPGLGRHVAASPGPALRLVADPSSHPALRQAGRDAGRTQAGAEHRRGASLGTISGTAQSGG